VLAIIHGSPRVGCWRDRLTLTVLLSSGGEMSGCFHQQLAVTFIFLDTVSTDYAASCYTPHKEFKMSSKVPIPPPGFDELSTDDQIEYIQDLWDHITSDPKGVSIPDWHKEILEERLTRYSRNGMEGTTWEEFEKELIEQLIKG